jgi:hypothetical protein
MAIESFERSRPDEPDGLVDGLARHENFGPMGGVTMSISTTAVAIENSSRKVTNVVTRISALSPAL